MAFDVKVPKVFGGTTRSGPILDTPDAPSRDASSQVYDPLASASMMDQMRSAEAESRLPRKVPLVGGLPIVRQFQILGVLLIVFLALAT